MTIELSTQSMCAELASNVSKHQEYEEALRDAERALLQVSQHVASQGAIGEENKEPEQLAKQQVSALSFGTSKNN